MDAEQLAKLPKRAQQEIRRLQSDNETLKVMLHDLTETPGDDTAVQWSTLREFVSSRVWHGLPRDTEVMFRTGPYQYVEVKLRDGVVEVTGDSTLVIKASYSNQVTIETER